MTNDKRSKEDESDRRRWPRLKPSDVPFLKRAAFSKGSKIEIINISRGGMLLETGLRLGPDLKIEVKIYTTEGTYQLEGIILRSSISSLKGPLRYRTAVIFKKPFELMDNAVDASKEEVEKKAWDESISGIPEKIDERQPQAGYPVKENEKTPAVLTVVASDKNGICLNETFSMNDW